MLTFDTEIVDEILAGTAKAFFCVHIKNEIGTLIFASTTHWADVTLTNGVTYEADDSVISVEPPQFSTTVDREQYKVVVANDVKALISTYGDMVGCRFAVYLVFIDAATGQARTDINKALPFYIGRIDGITGEYETGEVGTELYSIRAASPMMALEMNKGVFLSRDFIRSVTPNDSCADTVYQGSGSLILRWGR